MMKTLFLQPPSFDGFDGGAGSRYQAKREISSFWYPDLARPARRPGARQQADRRAAGAHSAWRPVLAAAKQHELVHHPHLDAVLRLGREGGAGAEGRQPALKIGFVGAKVAVQPDESLLKGAPIDFVARNEFDFTIKEVAEGRDFAAIDGISYRDARRRDRPQQGPRGAGGHGPAAVRHRGLQARPAHRGLFHRLPDAPLRLALHRPRLQEPLHLLPVAADGRRPSLPRAQPGACRRGDPARAKRISRRCGSSSSTTTPSPTTCRAPRRSRRNWASSASRGRATPRRTCRARR